jgi:magnesium transporter
LEQKLRLMVLKGGVAHLTSPLERVSELLQESIDLVWLDVASPTAQFFDRVGEEFGLHPLAMEDALHSHQRPKLDRYGRYDFVVLYAAGYDGGLATDELDLFLAKDFVITSHLGPIQEVDRVWENVARNPAVLGSVPSGGLLYLLADALVDGYFPVIDAIAERVDRLEDEVFGRGANVLPQVLELRRTLLELRRILTPERDIFNLLSRRDEPFFDVSLATYFTDVYDHLLRATDMLDIQRDLLTGILEAYLSVVSNSLNQVMKVLTAVATILMVMSLVAGIYGMNYALFPPNEWPYGFGLALSIMGLAGAGLAWVFRRRGWI